MKPDTSTILDDIAGLAGGALNLAGSAKQQVKEEIKSKIDEIIHDMDLVTREEFDRIENMLIKSRTSQEELLKRIEALEKTHN